MEKISTDKARRSLADLVRRVIAGDMIQLTSYGKPINVALVRLSDVQWRDQVGDDERLAELREATDGDSNAAPIGRP